MGVQTLPTVTFLKQLVATLPLSYAVARPRLLKLPVEALYVPNAVLGALAGAAAATLTWHCMRSEALAPRSSALTASAILLIVCAGLTSVSMKYQLELEWGVGYAQTYIQYFALSVLLVWALKAVLSRTCGTRMLRDGVRAAAAALLAGVMFVTFNHSVAVADHINRYWRYPREVLGVVYRRRARATSRGASARPSRDSWLRDLHGRVDEGLEAPHDPLPVLGGHSRQDALEAADLQGVGSGSVWRAMICQSWQPVARATSTYWFSRTASTALRMIRAFPAVAPIPSARMTLPSPWPSMAMIVSSTTRPGNAISVSMHRCRTVSILPWSCGAVGGDRSCRPSVATASE